MRDVLELPFVTQEQKYDYWQQSKLEIKKLRAEAAEAQARLVSIGVFAFDKDRFYDCHYDAMEYGADPNQTFTAYVLKPKA